jgi:dihydroflavonol-4-reductase
LEQVCSEITSFGYWCRAVCEKALCRSQRKAERQFGDLPIEIVTGDMAKVGEFAAHLQGNEVVFHTAAFFRDGYKGGRHWKELYDANVRGTAELFAQAYGAGVRRGCRGDVARGGFTGER